MPVFVTLQLQLDAIQWPCLFPYDRPWLCNTTLVMYYNPKFQHLSHPIPKCCEYRIHYILCKITVILPEKSMTGSLAQTISDTNHVLSNHNLSMTGLENSHDG